MATAAQNAFRNGVTNNGADAATITFVVPQSARAKLFYQCEYHELMGGTLNVVSAAATSVPPYGRFRSPYLAQ